MTTASTVIATIDDTLYQVTLADDFAHTWIADEPEELHGSNTSPTPTGLLLPASVPARRSR